jgi:HD-GYP domain-containing protein (c-di-GMP phosphodiesterase class II)
MQLIELESVRHLVKPGVPLPFNVRQSDHTLLLARGQVLETTARVEALFDRGMLVDITELQSPRDSVLSTSAAQLPKVWEQLFHRTSEALQAPLGERFDTVVEEVAQPLLALVEREPDLAIFQVLRQHGNVHIQYGVNHSIHCAIAAALAAQRLGWNEGAVHRAVKAALTMNVSMLELQGQLASQATPLTDDQRSAIHSHPMQSVHQPELAGISDPEWLQAIAQHHETGDGSGYPAGLREVTPLAALLHQCDVYTAKLSPRRSRDSMTADVAARSLFKTNSGDPMAAALIKEFGVYPPGSFVRLVSGETGLVIGRGPSAHTPRVSIVTDSRGATLPKPETCDTSRAGHAIAAALASSASPGIAIDQLMAALCA